MLHVDAQSNVGNPKSKIVVVLDNVRSLYNVGAVMRACDGAGVTRLLACGITPYPYQGAQDPRRGPVAARAGRELRKTALAAYDQVQVEWAPSVADAIARLRAEDPGLTVVAAERTPSAVPFWASPALGAPVLALVLGHEVDGVGQGALALADAVVEIPMRGAGASLNVAVAVGILLYEAIRRSTVT